MWQRPAPASGKGRDVPSRLHFSCEMGPQSLSASQGEAATANRSGGHLSREYTWGYRLPCRIFAIAHSALPHPLPRGTPHRLGATGTPQPWQTWTTTPVPPPQAGGACAILTRCAPSSCVCASPSLQDGKQAALEDASAPAHRGLYGKALREADLSVVAFVSCGGPTSRANLALGLGLIIKIVVINYNGPPILDF